MSSSSQMPGKDIITGYNDKRTARHSVSGCQSRVALEEHDSHVLWPSKCICPSGGVFNQCMKFWSADCGTGPGFLGVERDLWRRGGCGLSRTCSEEPFFRSLLGKKKAVKHLCKDSCFLFLTTPSNSSPCPCLTLFMPPEQCSSETSCTHAAANFSRFKRRACIYSKSIFTTILTYMLCIGWAMARHNYPSLPYWLWKVFFLFF